MPSSTRANKTVGHSRRRWPKNLRVQGRGEGGEEPRERVELGLKLDFLGEKKHVLCVDHSVRSTSSTDINYLEAVSGKKAEFGGLLQNLEGKEASPLFQIPDGE